MAWYKLDEEGNIEGLFKPLTPLINYVARLNGADQYWQLSEAISYSVGDSITMECTQPGASFDVLISTPSNALLVRRSNAGNVTFSGCTILINGVPAVNNSTPWPEGYSVFEMTPTVNAVVYDFGVRTDLKIEPFEGVIKSFSDSLGHTISLTNKAQGATQLATVGSVNATMVNYDESVWEQV